MRWIVTTLLGCSLVVLGGCGGTTTNNSGSGSGSTGSNTSSSGSGSGGSASCSPTFTPCGGDLTGTWTYQTTCNPGSATSASCPTATEDISTNLSGSITFGAGNTYTTDVTIAESGTVTLPSSCVGGLSCSMLDADQTTSGITLKETCTANATQGCDCTVSIAGTATATGTYITAGDNFSTTPAGGSASTPAGYCVNGSQLEIAGGVMGTAAANEYTIFTM